MAKKDIDSAQNKALAFMRDEFDILKKKVKSVEEKYENKIKEQPIQQVAIAFGVGIAVGALVAYLTRGKKE